MNSKTLKVFVVSISMFPLTALAKSIFGDQAVICLSLAKHNTASCAASNICPSPSSTKKVLECFSKLNLKDGSCSIESESLMCRFPSADISFPQSKGCNIAITIDQEGKPRTYLSSTKNSEKKCVISGYNFDGRFPIAAATLNSDGSWIAPKPVVAFGFEKFVQPKKISVILVAKNNSDEWTYAEGGSACGQKTYDLGDARYDSNIRQEMLKAIGFDKIPEMKPERHYVGRASKENFAIIKTFKLKETSEICSYKIPKGTRITTQFDAQTCISAIDGPIALTGLPYELFPSLADSEDAKENATVTCAPSAKKKANIGQLILNAEGRARSIQMPILDWEDCDCEIEKNYNAGK